MKNVKTTVGLNKKLMLFHLLGVLSLLGAVSVMAITFFSITVHGYCLTVEDNLAIRWFEAGVAGYSVVYFLYLVWFTLPRIFPNKRRVTNEE
jgi:hypothetical protein